jgi:hypothetical protein
LRNHIGRGLVLIAGAFLVAVGLSASANAGTLRKGSTGGSASVTGALPGQVSWTYYETTEIGRPCANSSLGNDSDGCNHAGFGDAIIRLINPNGAANTSLQGAAAQPVCAMIYVFDDDEEMLECCGCPVTSAGLDTFSVEFNLTANPVVGGEPRSTDNGVIAVVAASLNPEILTFGSPSNGHFCTVGQTGACNVGCDPTANPGYAVTTANNLLGSITHAQIVQAGPPTSTGVIGGITEVALSDDAAGDPTNLTYLKNQCGALIGNGTGAGVCSCPIE